MVKDKLLRQKRTTLGVWWTLIGQEGNMSKVADGLGTVVYKTATKLHN